MVKKKPKGRLRLVFSTFLTAMLLQYWVVLAKAPDAPLWKWDFVSKTESWLVIDAGMKEFIAEGLILNAIPLFLPVSLWVSSVNSGENWFDANKIISHELSETNGEYTYMMQWIVGSDSEEVIEQFVANMDALIAQNPTMWNLKFRVATGIGTKVNGQSTNGKNVVKVSCTFALNPNVQKSVVDVVSVQSVVSTTSSVSVKDQIDAKFSDWKKRNELLEELEIRGYISISQKNQGAEHIYTVNPWFDISFPNYTGVLAQGEDRATKDNLAWQHIVESGTKKVGARADFALIFVKTELSGIHPDIQKMKNDIASQWTTLGTVDLTGRTQAQVQNTFANKTLAPKYKDKIIFVNWKKPSLQGLPSKNGGIAAFHGSLTDDWGLIGFGFTSGDFSFGVLENGAILCFFDPQLGTAALGGRSMHNWDPMANWKWIAIEESLSWTAWRDIEDPNLVMLRSSYLLSLYLQNTYGIPPENITTSAKWVTSDYPSFANDDGLSPDESLSVKDLWKGSREISVASLYYDKNSTADSASIHWSTEKYTISGMWKYIVPANWKEHTHIDTRTFGSGTPYAGGIVGTKSSIILPSFGIDPEEFTERKTNPYLVKEDGVIYFDDQVAKNTFLANILNRIQFSENVYANQPSFKVGALHSIVYWKMQYEKYNNMPTLH